MHILLNPINTNIFASYACFNDLGKKIMIEDVYKDEIIRNILFNIHQMRVMM